MTITYADVQRIYRLEKNSTILEKLPDNFYIEVNFLLSQVDSEHKKYIEKIVSEIYEKRKQKILLQAIRGGDVPVNATSKEKQLYLEILEKIENYRKAIFSDTPEVVLEEKKEEPKENENRKEEVKELNEEKKNSDLVKVRILAPLPAIAGYNSLSYGPFSENDEVLLPKKIAKILIERGVAVSI
ncbi:MAG: hypothetical protein QW802_04565 [Candidatus Altiarchaeota archaeon]